MHDDSSKFRPLSWSDFRGKFAGKGRSVADISMISLNKIEWM